MQENLILDETNTLDGYQIIVTGINWHKAESLGKYRSKKDFSEKLPEQITLVLPENIASKESFKEGADYALDKVVEWLFYEASKYAVTSFHKNTFDVNVMITNMLKAIEGDDEEAKEEEHITDAMELLHKLGIEVTVDAEE
jgi:aspartate carbamoyltransferase catalytic subunit